MRNHKATPLRRSTPALDHDRVDRLAREVLGQIAEKWTLLVIEALEQGPLRFTRLKEQLPGVSQKVLTSKLRALEANGLIRREIFAEVPARVEYRLTPLGLSLGEASCTLWTWAAKHAEDVDSHRRARSAPPQHADRPRRGS